MSSSNVEVYSWSATFTARSLSGAPVPPTPRVLVFRWVSDDPKARAISLLEAEGYEGLVIRDVVQGGFFTVDAQKRALQYAADMGRHSGSASSGHGGPREGAGRDPRTPGEPLTVPVTIMLSQGQVDELDKRRGDAPRSTWCRGAVLAHLERVGLEKMEDEQRARRRLETTVRANATAEAVMPSMGDGNE